MVCRKCSVPPSTGPPRNTGEGNSGKPVTMSLKVKSVGRLRIKPTEPSGVYSVRRITERRKEGFSIKGSASSNLPCAGMVLCMIFMISIKDNCTGICVAGVQTIDVKELGVVLLLGYFYALYLSQTQRYASKNSTVNSGRYTVQICCREYTKEIQKEGGHRNTLYWVVMGLCSAPIFWLGDGTGGFVQVARRCHRSHTRGDNTGRYPQRLMPRGA